MSWFIRRRQSDVRDFSDAIRPELQALPTPVAVDIRAQHDSADRPHEEARAEGHERQKETGELVARRKESLANGFGIIAEHHEIIHFEEIAARYDEDRLHLFAPLD